jgi:hypothetical protein
MVTSPAGAGSVVELHPAVAMVARIAAFIRKVLVMLWVRLK